MSVYFGEMCLGSLTKMEQSCTGYVRITTLAYPVTGLLNTESDLTIDGSVVLENCMCVAEPNNDDYTLCTYIFIERSS